MFLFDRLIRSDSVAIRMLCFPVLVTLASATFSSFWPTLALITALPIWAISIGYWFIALLYSMLIATWRRKWRLSLALTGVLGLAPSLSVIALQLHLGDEIHLALMYPAYFGQIAASSAKSPPIIFEWGSLSFGAFASPPDEQILIFDPSGKCANPFGEYGTDMIHLTPRLCTGWHPL